MGAHALLAGTRRAGGREPLGERDALPLEDGPDRDGELLAATLPRALQEACPQSSGAARYAKPSFRRSASGRLRHCSGTTASERAR